jgi:RND family efflux transporter MFP subunit
VPSNFARRRINHSSAVAVLALASLATLSACKRAEEAAASEVRPVRVMTIAKGVAGDTVVLVGTVQAQTEINLSFRIDGRLIERNVNVGEQVVPGQLVARLDSQNEETGVESARAQLASARAQLAEAQINYERMRDLVAEDAVSRATFDQAETLRKTAQSQVESMQSQATLAGNRLSYTRLVSDVAGVVTAQGAEPGEVVGAGRMIVQVAREGGRDATFDLPARIKDSAPLNTEIAVVLTADPKIMANGVVREISPRADPVTGTFRIKVRLLNAPATMRLGSTVTGRLKLAATSGTEIPPSAVIRSDRQTAVWVVDPKTGTVGARNIEVRASDSARVEVASGLNPGDIVVTAGVQALRPGQKVRLLETK